MPGLTAKKATQILQQRSINLRHSHGTTLRKPDCATFHLRISARLIKFAPWLFSYDYKIWFQMDSDYQYYAQPQETIIDE